MTSESYYKCSMRASSFKDWYNNIEKKFRYDLSKNNVYYYVFLESNIAKYIYMETCIEYEKLKGNNYYYTFIDLHGDDDDEITFEIKLDIEKNYPLFEFCKSLKAKSIENYLKSKQFEFNLISNQKSHFILESNKGRLINRWPISEYLSTYTSFALLHQKDDMINFKINTDDTEEGFTYSARIRSGLFLEQYWYIDKIVKKFVHIGSYEIILTSERGKCFITTNRSEAKKINKYCLKDLFNDGDYFTIQVKTKSSIRNVQNRNFMILYYKRTKMYLSQFLL